MSAKYFPSHWNLKNFHSSVPAGINLKASTTSYLAINDPRPALTMAYPISAGDVIDNLRTAKVFTASLKEQCSGADKFMIGRTLFFFAVHAAKVLIEKSKASNLSKGPITNFFETQYGIVSFISSLCFVAEEAFGIRTNSKGYAKGVFEPFFKISIHF
jgi:hypothetical protein